MELVSLRFFRALDTIVDLPLTSDGLMSMMRGSQCSATKPRSRWRLKFGERRNATCLNRRDVMENNLGARPTLKAGPGQRPHHAPRAKVAGH
jgi:hypothetical protein